ncbi:unnamed protein product [Mucor circinelloides]
MHQPQEQHQRRELERKSMNSSVASKTRPKSTFLSWILNGGADSKSSSPSKDQKTSLSDENDSIYRISAENNGLSTKKQYLNAKLEIPDDTNVAKSYADTENAYKRNNNIGVTNNDKSTAAIASCAPGLNASYHQEQVQIPDRRQSHLYTLYLNREAEEGSEEVTALIDYRHKSYYQSQLSPAINVIDVTSSNSTTLTRSATWQPSSSTSQIPPSNQFLSPQLPPPPVPPHTFVASTTQATAENMIPARRTSRNYSEDPEIQAKLDALLQSEKAAYLSHMIQNSNLSNTNMYRRSTTPKSRKS